MHRQHLDIKQRRELERRLGTTFRRPRLLVEALVHRSYRPEGEPDLSNERLEFLGDAVLGQVIAEHLYHKFPDWSEGDLTKLKAAVVSEVTLSEAARHIGLGDFLILAKGEAQSGGRDRPSLLSDALEAIIGATYLDRGLRAARALVLRLLDEPIRVLEQDEQRRDYKTLLQELTQSRHKQPPVYRVAAEEGPDHDKTFAVEVRFSTHLLGEGVGKSKKEAEQKAAKEALEDMERLERIVGSAN
ncbi:MAG: ribonuclease III [Armatimonadota bacterium]|nr:MAG: ribonuclease III [Armatimonadota bacterium]